MKNAIWTKKVQMTGGLRPFSTRMHRRGAATNCFRHSGYGGSFDRFPIFDTNCQNDW